VDELKIANGFQCISTSGFRIYISN